LRDSHSRSLLKALVYKLGSVLVLASLSWVFTRDVMRMFAMTLSYEAMAIIGYYVHERLWDRIRWGKTLQTER